MRPAATASDLARDAARDAGRLILQAAQAAFDRRLDRSARAPLAVGVSGGSDSLALLLAARAWAEQAGRPLTVLTVDHGLRPESRVWTAQVAEIARGLDLPFHALAWTGAKPAHGLPAAAREARHRLLAGAARAIGARVLVLGHTADDVAEAARMRQEGSSVGTPREWSPSPAWPQGRELFLLRPLLAMGRLELRRRLAPSGIDWIEDPANDDEAFARARARRQPAAAAAVDEDEPVAAIPAEAFSVDRFGAVRLFRPVLNRLPAAAARRLLAAACVCAGGGDRLPRRARADALLTRLKAQDRLIATLAGARIEAGNEVLICRDAGRLAAARRGFSAAVDGVWDGRFEAAAAAELKPLRGLGSRLDVREAEPLRRLPPQVRPGLPVLSGSHGSVTCPLLTEQSAQAVRCLVGSRLAAAVGLIGSEAQLVRTSDGGDGVGALS